MCHSSVYPLPPLGAAQFSSGMVVRCPLLVRLGGFPASNQRLCRGLFGLDNGDLGLWEYDSGWQVNPQRDMGSYRSVGGRISARSVDGGWSS